MPTDDLLHREISEAIIGAAMKVLNTLKPGLDEKAYENALVIELRMRGHKVDQQKRYLTITHLRLAILLNFKFADLRWKRVIR